MVFSRSLYGVINSRQVGCVVNQQSKCYVHRQSETYIQKTFTCTRERFVANVEVGNDYMLTTF